MGLMKQSCYHEREIQTDGFGNQNRGRFERSATLHANFWDDSRRGSIGILVSGSSADIS